MGGGEWELQQLLCTGARYRRLLLFQQEAAAAAAAEWVLL
jgi:hypothetical protein